ncbi:MAG: hypothetical protein WBA43_12730 [Elainellaceae cyanobacterium]
MVTLFRFPAVAWGVLGLSEVPRLGAIAHQVFATDSIPPGESPHLTCPGVRDLRGERSPSRCFIL